MTEIKSDQVNEVYAFYPGCC